MQQFGKFHKSSKKPATRTGNRLPDFAGNFVKNELLVIEMQGVAGFHKSHPINPDQ